MNTYDAIVVGSGNSGLVSALSLLKKGNKVLLLEANNNVGGLSRSIVKGRYEFETSLHNLYLNSSNNLKYNINNIFDDLKVEEKVSFNKIPELVKIITPDANYTIPFGIENFINKFDEWFLGCRESVESFFELAKECREALDYIVSCGDNVDFSYIKENYANFMKISNSSVSKVLDALGMPLNVQDLINSMWLYFGSTESEISFVEYAVFLLNVVEYGVKVPTERSYAISLAMANSFLEQGGEIRLNNVVSNLVIEDGKINGVRLSDGTLLYSEKVIVNSSLNNVYGNLINPEVVPREALKNINKREIGAKTVTVHLGLNRSASELNLTNYSYMLLNSLNSDAEYNKMMYVNNGNQIAVVHNNAIEGFSPKGTCIISLTTLFFENAFDDFVSEDNYYSSIEDVALELINVFQKRTGVIIKDYIEEMYIETPIDCVKISNSPSGSIYGYKLKGLDNLLPKLLNRYNENYIKGLAVCSGFEGDAFGYSSALISGIMAVDDLSEGESDK